LRLLKKGKFSRVERPTASAKKAIMRRMNKRPPFDYHGDESWQGPITEALRKVVDPEIALSILDVGLVYHVALTADKIVVQITMTSAACPVADMIIDEIQMELDQILPPEVAIDVQLVWAPPWSPERMSEHARHLMHG